MINKHGIFIELNKDEINSLFETLTILEDIKKKAKDSDKKYIYTLNDSTFACELIDINECIYTIYALLNENV